MKHTLLVKKLTSTGFTQKQIAEKVGVSQAAISKIERGLTKDPGSSIGAAIEKMAKRLRK